MRAAPSRLVRLLVGVAAVAAIAIAAPISLPDRAAATVTEPASADSPVASVTLLPHFPGEPTWPSARFPTAALRIDLASPGVSAGETAVVELSEGLTAAAAPGSLTDDAGTDLAHYAVSADGRRITITFSDSAASVVNLEAQLGIFVSSDRFAESGGEITGEATVGETVFPLSLAYPATALSEQNTTGTWLPSAGTGTATGTGTEADPALRFVARSFVPADPGATGGQWIGVSPATGWPGTLALVPGTTRVFAHAERPDVLADYTAADAALALDVDFTLNNADLVNGELGVGVRIPHPKAGVYVVEQTFEVADAGPALFDAPNPELPAGSRAVFGAGSQIGSTSIEAHDSATESGAISTLTFLASSGGTASGSPLQPGLTADRTTTELDREPGATDGNATLTLTNSGNSALDATVTDTLVGSGARGEVSSPAADHGSASTDGAGLTWRGRLAPGETATITYSYAAQAARDKPGSLSFTGSASATVAHNNDVQVGADIADDSLVVDALPSKPGTPGDPGEPGEPGQPGEPVQPGDPDPSDADVAAAGPQTNLANTGQAAPPWSLALPLALALTLASIGAVLITRPARSSR